MMQTYFRNWIIETFDNDNDYHSYYDPKVINYFMKPLGWNNIKRNLKGMIIKVNGKNYKIESIRADFIEFDNMKDLANRDFSGDGSIDFINIESLRLTFTIEDNVLITLDAADMITNDEIEIIKDGNIVL